MKRVYLDNNATTPCDPRVVETMVPYFRKIWQRSQPQSPLRMGS
jgi:cysteine desulfurase